ncbi:SCO6745 family protein [Brevibacterium paucivorans]|uniref:SCO6745 family protein n=1 Tax=Brevibacterium paucivorans TaxID=170994 RepID=UPI00321AB02F
MTRSKVIRSTTKRLDTVHSASYFAQEMVAELDTLGVERDAQYLAQRAAPLGRASAELVTATFYSFAPAYVSAHVPACWEQAAPEEIHAARVRAAEKIVEKLVAGPGGSELTESIPHIRRALAPVLEASDVCGKPLYAAHVNARKSTGDDAGELVQLWWDITLLREFRGDAHLAALVATGVGSVESIVLDSATGKSFAPYYMRKMRGWTSEEWAEVAEKLAMAGFLTSADDKAVLTEEGVKLRAHVEALTDMGVASTWDALSDEHVSDLQGLATLWAAAVAKSEIIPPKLFG